LIISDKRRLYELAIQEFWNFGDLFMLLESKNAHCFTLKIINETLVHYITFEKSTIDKNEFKK
jgi:hypothetical protein